MPDKLFETPDDSTVHDSALRELKTVPASPTTTNLLPLKAISLSL
jgi:hypothetical protein